MALTCENETAMNVSEICVCKPSDNGAQFRRRQRRRLVVNLVAVVVGLAATAACAETPRTATNFCRVLANRIGDITTPPESNDDVQRLIEHYDRLVEVAPIEVEGDLTIIRDLFQAASQVNVKDLVSVQAVADAAYDAERAAEDAGVYVGATCGLDLSTGLSVQVPTTP